MSKKQLLFLFVISPVLGFLAFALFMLILDSGVIESGLLGFILLAFVFGLCWWSFIRMYRKLGD